MSLFSFLGGAFGAYNARVQAENDAAAELSKMQTAGQINLSNQKKIIELQQTNKRQTELRALAITVVTTSGKESKSIIETIDILGNPTSKTVTKTIPWTAREQAWAKNFLGPDYAGLTVQATKQESVKPNSSGSKLPTIDPNQTAAALNKIRRGKKSALRIDATGAGIIN